MSKGETDDGVATARTDFPCWGMTLRDYFAGQALASAYDRWLQEMDETSDVADAKIARWCYETADAMLTARER